MKKMNRKEAKGKLREKIETKGTEKSIILSTIILLFREKRDRKSLLWFYGCDFGFCCHYGHTQQKKCRYQKMS
jgi:hypothetical protein